uniref:Transmembrane protein n=1 Tax=Caenorhabditis japonica TaxID=281687 RepID=A0A8R1ESI1_CAEJA
MSCIFDKLRVLEARFPKTRLPIRVPLCKSKWKNRVASWKEWCVCECVGTSCCFPIRFALLLLLLLQFPPFLLDRDVVFSFFFFFFSFLFRDEFLRRALPLCPCVVFSIK